MSKLVVETCKHHVMVANCHICHPSLTREDVLLLREVMESVNSVYPLVLNDDDEARFRSLADRIEAMLPPEK